MRRDDSDDGFDEGAADKLIRGSQEFLARWAPELTSAATWEPTQEEIEDASEKASTWFGSRAPSAPRDDPERLWFLLLAERAIMTSRLLRRIDERGRVRLSKGESLSWVRSKLLRSVLRLLHGEDAFGWAEALEEYPPFHDEVEYTSASTLEKSDVQLSMGPATLALRNDLQSLLEAFGHLASDGEVGKILRRIVIRATWVVISMELELREQAE